MSIHTLFFHSLLPTFILLLFISNGCNTGTNKDKDQTALKSGLPYFGEYELIEKSNNGKTVFDTLHHTVPEFVFTDQDSTLFTNELVAGKIHVANFFFTSCPAICPAMTEQMRRLQNNTKDINGLYFLSHTIDPKRDTIPKLKKYIRDRSLNTENWFFLYDSDREYIHNLAKEGYLINAMEDKNAEGGFLHSEHFILVDKQGHVRGLYEGTDPKRVDQLEKDIRLLTQEK